MAVQPGPQRSGIGSALVRAGLSALRAAGHEVVIVLGHPEYYPRFGFVRASEHDSLGAHVPDEAFMVFELTPGALAGRGGVVRYWAEFGAVWACGRTKPAADRVRFGALVDARSRDPAANPYRNPADSWHNRITLGRAP
jgi:hypothetical protein